MIPDIVENPPAFLPQIHHVGLGMWEWEGNFSSLKNNLYTK
jgi:hypothetical protein